MGGRSSPAGVREGDSAWIEGPDVADFTGVDWMSAGAAGASKLAFGDFVLDRERRQVLRPNGEALQLSPRLFNALELFADATSLGSTESLVEHRSRVEGVGSPVPGDLLRLSVGLEDVGDLIADLEQALGSNS